MPGSPPRGMLPGYYKVIALFVTDSGHIILRLFKEMHRPESKAVGRIMKFPRRLVALPDHGALVADWYYAPDRVYHVDPNGDVSMPYHSFSTSGGPTRAIMVNRNVVYVWHSPGVLTISHLNHLDRIDRQVRVDVGDAQHGCVIGQDLLLLADTSRGEVFMYHVTSGTKAVKVKGLNAPFSVAMSGKDDHTLYVVSEAGTNSLKVYDHNWTFLHDIGCSGTGDGELRMPRDVTVTPNKTVLVADYENNRVSEFHLSNGNFVRHRVTAEADGIGHPVSISYRHPYLWVAYQHDGSSFSYVKRFLSY